jgi:hypothetical protein
VWDNVKAGIVKGFSVEGLFNYVPVKTEKMTIDEAYKRIKRILNETLLDD